jgi:hypothetical protein
MNGLVNAPEGGFVRKYYNHKPEGGTVTPVIVVCGRKSSSAWKNWTAVDHSALKDAWTGVRAKGEARRVKADPIDEVNFEQLIRNDAVHTARIVKKDGRSLLEIDGCVAPPVAFHTVYHHSGQSEIAAGLPLVKNGVNVVIPMVEGGTGNHACWDSKGYNANHCNNTKHEPKLNVMYYFMNGIEYPFDSDKRFFNVSFHDVSQKHYD